MRYVLTLTALLLTACSGGSQEQAQPQAVGTQPPATPAPTSPPPPQPPPAPVTVVVVGSSIDDTLAADGCCHDVVGPFRAAGFTLESIDAPCHGQDFVCNRAGLPGGLEGWAGAVTEGVDIFSPFCERLRQHIGERPVFVAGISRGGYAVLRCDLGAPARGIVAYAPVTDLYRLTEFAGVPRVSGFELLPQRIPTLIRIGRQDERVGTDAAVAYAQMSGAELQLLNSPGHTAPEDGGGIEFIRAHR